jgi:hypothetical protein
VAGRTWIVATVGLKMVFGNYFNRTLVFANGASNCGLLMPCFPCMEESSIDGAAC